MLKIWNEEEAKNASDDQLFVRLKNKEKTDIILVVVDKSGNEIDNGNILVIDNDLKVIYTQESINEKILLKTNLKDEVLIYSNQDIVFLVSTKIRDSFSRKIASMIDEKDKEELGVH